MSLPIGERVLAVLPKNDVNEYKVMAKGVRTRATGAIQHFFDIREWWFKDGPTTESIPTKKGVMINRRVIGRILTAIITDLNDEDMLLDTDVEKIIKKLSSIKTMTRAEMEAAIIKQREMQKAAFGPRGAKDGIDPLDDASTE